jgi:hypothetical protein
MSEPRTAATWDDFACDGQKCSCHDPFLCSDCGCLHIEAEASRSDVETLVTLLRPYVRDDVNRVEAAQAIVKAYEAEDE